MSEFRAGEEVLQTARLQRDALPEDHGALIVEGPSDRWLFAPLCYSPKQVVIGGGKSVVTEAHSRMRPEDHGRLLFLVDCDGDVAEGRLAGRPDLLISEHADVEGDLIALGLLEVVVENLVDTVASGDESAATVAERVRKEAVRLAEPLGRVRRGARARSIPLSKARRSDIDYMAIRARAGPDAEQESLTQLSRAGALTPYQVKRIAEGIGGAPRGYHTCNGHDLIEAVQVVLRQDYRVSKARASSVDTLLRMTMRDTQWRERWSVVKRLRRWETGSGHAILKT